MKPQSVSMPRSHRAGRSRWMVAALLLGALSGCKKEETSAPVSSTPATTPAGQGTSGPQASTPVKTPPKAGSLTPSIHELGAEGMVPREVVLEFPRVVSPEDSEVRKGTVFTVSPNVPGQLSYRGGSTLVFTPQGQSFAFSTKYTVTLESLELGDGTVLKPDTAGAWKHTFTTPAFSFLRLSPRQVDVSQGKLEVDLVFSGPVVLANVRRLISFSVDGAPVSDVKLRSQPSDPYTVTAVLGGASAKPGAEVRFTLKAGLEPAGRKTAPAPAGSGSFTLEVGKRMDITNAYVQEGSTGHFIEVRCRERESSDAPSHEEGEEDYDYYDNEGTRCSLDEDSAEARVHFNPPVKFSVSPSRWGFRLMGDFKRGTYAMRIDAGARSATGGALLSTYERSFSISARSPQLSFGTTGRYLPRSAWRNLPLNHLNLDEVSVVVRNVPQENLLFWMSDDSREAADERTSNVLLEKTLPVQGAQDTLATTWLDVGALVPSTTKGLVELTAKGGSKTASSRILLTDLSLVAKRGAAPPGSEAKEEVFVWALGMETTEPLSGVEVSLVKKSGQAVARCTTSGADGCKLTVPAAGVDPAEPFALLARKGEDFTYLKYTELKTDIANSDVQGVPYRSEEPYRASLYSDRGVYRPGDTAHVVAVLRERSDAAPPAGVPVELRVVDPRERDLRKVTVKTNEAGLVALDVPFEAYQDTGAYRVVLAVAGKTVATYGLNVEEFVPERMKVTAQTQKAGYLAGEEVPVTVEAAYLFGGSAEGSPVEVTCRLEPSEFEPEQNAQLDYGVWRPEGSEVKATVLGQVKAELDEKGQALVSCPAQQTAGGFKGPARLVAQASVFEAGSGRSTVGEASVPVHPEAYYVGLKANVQKVKAGQPFTVTGLVVDWKGAPYTKATRPLELEYLRLDEEYGNFYDEASGEERYQRHLRPVREGRATAKAEGGTFTVQVTPSTDAAGYVVRVKSGAAQTDLKLEGSGRYYWWDDDSSARVDQTPRPARPTSLTVELPRSGKVGEALAVKVKAPYRGRMLFTAETDGVRAAEWKAVEPGEVTWSFTPSAFAPNVYVSAFLVKDPHLESAQSFMPDRAFGVASVSLEPVDYTQPLTLKAPEEVRSNERLSVDLELGAMEPGTYATVAVVDEGILSLTRFRSPDPLAALFSKRALGVQTYETLGWTLLIPPAGASRSTGGDDDGGAAGRVQPVKPVALWSGVLPVPASGKLRVPFQLPQYRGAVRVMAVTAGPKRIGHASAQVLVRDPLVLQATLPRFLSEGDEIQIPVFVTNLSGKPQDVKVSLTAETLAVPGMAMPATTESPLRLLGKSVGQMRLENGKAATLVFQAKAVQTVGAARLKVTAEGGGHTSFEQLDVPLLPSGPRERKVQRLELAEGKLDLAPYLQGWVPTSERSTFWVTANPYAQSFQHLSYLVRYPYGCIEQTTSSTRPLLYVSELVDSVDPTLTANAKIEDMVASGIQRVFSMQTPSGGFGYWPGASEPVEWGTAYATHMLLDAQKRKYAVAQDRLDDALTWMGERVKYREGTPSVSYGYYDGGEAYMHYVLALSGKGQKARVQKLIEQLPGRRYYSAGDRAEQEYMLQAALYLAGDRRYEKELRNPDISPLKDERWNSWSFYSDRRRRGFMLSTFQDLFGQDASGEPLAQRVADGLAQERSSYYTTQELVWGITGLGKRVADSASSFSPAVLTADGKEQKAQGQVKQRTNDRTWALARASERKGLTLDVPKKDAGKLYLILNSEGVRTGGQFRLGGESLSLTRHYRDLSGSELDVKGAGVNLADLIYVEVKIKNTSRERIQNIALVDRLPAGWEIENARLGRGGAVEWSTAEEQWNADYVNLRDDRVEVFGALEPGETRSVIYAVRAVTSGAFTLPPVEAEAMYDPRIWAREAGGTVRVAGPWADFLL